MAKKMLTSKGGDAAAASYGHGRGRSKIHPRSPSESNLPRRMAFESAAEQRLGALSTSSVNFAPSGSGGGGGGGGGHVTMLKNRVLYHSRSDFREQEARV